MSGVALWRIAADTPDHLADDRSGAGAEKTGGRWNTPGVPVLYSSTSIALAALETLVHLDGQHPLPLNRFLVRIDVPAAQWQAALDLPLQIGWESRPPGRISIAAGDQWCAARSSLLARVPSVIVPEEMNVLINPRHPDAPRLGFTRIRLWHYDPRARS